MENEFLPHEPHRVGVAAAGQGSAYNGFRPLMTLSRITTMAITRST